MKPSNRQHRQRERRHEERPLPFANAALLDVPRREIEYTLVKACCINPWAFRLV
jgi:hypothetical protein